MKIIIAIMALASLTLSSIAGENLIENGSFSEGSKGWKGDRNIEFETPTSTNQVCKIEVDEKYDVVFYQKIKTRGVKRLTLKCRVKKSTDYDSINPGFPVRFYFTEGYHSYVVRRPGGGRGIKEAETWENVECVFFLDEMFSEETLRALSKGKLRIAVSPGYSGYVMIDDIVVTGE